MTYEKRIVILVVFALYLLAMIGIGLFFYRKKMNNDEFVLGGRQLNPWVAAMSAQASDMSGWLLMGLPGLACLGVLSNVGSAKEAIWTAIGLLIGTFLNWVLVAKRLRVYTEISGNSLTISSFLENRFKEKSGALRVVSAIALCIFFTVYAASMFSGSAVLFSYLFDIPYITSLIIAVVVIVVYVFLGGFLAVSWTDFFQGILMFFALIIVPLLCIKALNGDQTSNVATIIADAFKMFPKDGDNFTWMGLVGALGWGLGYFGMPHILVRFMAIKDPRKTKPSIIIAMVWVTISLFASIMVGMLAAQLIPNITNEENIFVEIVVMLFPTFIAGILLSAVLAAIMSTADSQLLVASTSLSNDVYAFAKMKISKKKSSDKELLWVARITVVVLALIGLLIALDENSKVFYLVKYAWGGLGSAFGPVMLFSLYNKKLNKYGAVSSIITGVVVSIVFKYGLSQLGGIWAIYELVPGFIFATIALFAVSYATANKIKPQDKQLIEEEYEQMLDILNGFKQEKKQAKLSKNNSKMVTVESSATTNEDIKDNSSNIK